MAETVASRCRPNRGRKISRDTVLRLIAAEAGHCPRPECPTGFLWHQMPDGSSVRLGEVAHIIAASLDGPRGSAKVNEADLVAFENLVLLCPTCHTIVDGAPQYYTAEMMTEWKRTHERRLSDLLGVVLCPTRAQARAHVEPLLQQNRAVWQLYGPDSPDSWRPEVASAWLSETQEVILPNNVRIERLVESNVHLLTTEEQLAFAQFRAHAKALQLRHIAGVVNPGAPRFPARFDNVFSDSVSH